MKISISHPLSCCWWLLGVCAVVCQNRSSWGSCWVLQCPGRWVILVSSVWFAISVQFANLASSPCQNEEKRNLSLGGHVGFDSLPDQLVSKSVTQGFSFNILCVGEHSPLQIVMGGGWDQDFLSVLLCHRPWQWLKQVRNAKLIKTHWVKPGEFL